jgi:hypothetical protein
MYAFVTQSAAISINDIPLSISEGDVWAADDPVVKAYPSLFALEPNEVKRSAPAPVAKRTRK